MEARLDAVDQFLRSLPRFRDLPDGLLTDDDWRELAVGATLWGFRAGDIVAFPDERPDGWLVVAEGCLVLHSKQRADLYLGVREDLDASLEGLWKGQTDGTYVVVSSEAWSSWLRPRPQVAQHLGVPVSRPLPRSLKGSPVLLEPGERVDLVVRRSAVFLLRRTAIPALVSLALATFSLLVGFPVAVFPLAGLVLSAALVALFAWEWSVSCLVVTDRCVLIRQIDTWDRRSEFEKLSLDRLREVTFRRQGLVDALLGLVSLQLVGESAHALVFQGLSARSEVLEVLEHLRRERQTPRPDRGTIRRALAHRVLAHQAGRAREPALLLAAQGGPAPASPTSLGWRRQNGGVVSFRRHPWHLLRRLLPLLGWSALVVGLGALGAALVPAATQGLLVAVGALLLLPLGRGWYEVADWSNDHLELDGETIRLLHRKPLWQGEIRQEGDVAHIEQAGVRKSSLAELVFDFGTVTVSLGASEPLVFEHADHPEWVQTEIFAHREAVRLARERRAAVERLDQVADILDTWEEARRAGYFEGEPSA